ncbi:Ff.00g064700.m01.CDS01 [Fusarium sp. VM40]|nr:Ff.00g064700.m01.CDS01 [Fusarium sp. VM40]
MPPPSVTKTDDFRFVTCSKPGCSSSLASSEYKAMTLRAGYNMYYAHDYLRDYGEAEEHRQAPGVGLHLLRRRDPVIKTMVRKNNSPLIGKLSPFVYMLAATCSSRSRRLSGL